MKILMVLTSHDQPGNTGRKTGFRLEEFKEDKAAQKALAHTPKLADMRSEDSDTIFYVGGHGSEEAAVNLTRVVPLLVEDELNLVDGGVVTELPAVRRAA